MFNFLLLLFGSALSFIIGFCGLWICIQIVLFEFDVVWYIFPFAYLPLIGVAYGFGSSLPLLVDYFFARKAPFYKATILLNTVSRMIGLYFIIKIILDSNYTEYGNIYSFLIRMWDLHTFKTILLAFPLFGLILAVLYTIFISPFLMIIELSKEKQIE
jgi:hypothetical protein